MPTKDFDITILPHLLFKKWEGTSESNGETSADCRPEQVIIIIMTIKT